MTGSTRNPQPQAAGGSPEGQERPQADLLDAEEIAGEEVLLDDEEEVDVIEEDEPAEPSAPAAAAAAPEPEQEPDDGSADETREMSAVTLKTSIEDVLASLGLDETPPQGSPAPPLAEETPAQGTPAPPPAIEAGAADTSEPAITTPRMPPAATPPRVLPPEPESSTGVAVPTPRMAPAGAAFEEPTGPLKTLLMEPAPEALTPAMPPPVTIPRPPPAPALPPPRSPSRPPAPPVRAEFDAAVTNEMPRTTIPMVPRPPRPSPVPVPTPDETTPTGRVAVPPHKREGTDPMMKAHGEAPRSRRGTDPMMKASAERRREGTDPMMKAPAERRDGDGKREGTDPMMKAPAERRDGEQTNPMMQLPAEPSASRTSPAALVPAADPTVMTGAFAAVTAPEQVLPFRARTGTIPPERPPPAPDLSGVLPFRPAARSSPAPSDQGDPYTRMTPADPIPASRREPPYIPAPSPMSAPANALAPQSPQGLYGPAGTSSATYPPAPTPLAAMYGPPASPEKQWGHQDKQATSSVPTGQVLVPQGHDGLPFHAGHGAAAPQALPPQAMLSPGSQPMMQAMTAQQLAAPASPAASTPPPRPAALPLDAWKLQPSPLLFPFAAPGTLPQPQPVARAAGPAMQQAQPYGQSYAAGSEPGIVAPASLGLNAPRLSLEQYACMAAELAVAPTSAVQVRARYGLDDSSHLAEQGAWQRRFSLDAQLFASYSSLFQHYRDWLSQSVRR